MTAALFVAGLAAFVLGGVVDGVVGVGRSWQRATPYVLAVVGSVAETVAGVRAMGPSRTTINLTSVVGIGRSGLLLDHLAGLFLTLLFFIGTAVSITFIGWSRRTGFVHRRGIASGYLLLLTAVALVIAAADVFTFLFAWELLSVSFYVLTSISRERASQATSAWLTAAVSKFGGAALLVAFLILSSHSGSLMLSSWRSLAPGAAVDSAWILIVVGFGAKLGVVPFQVWLPVGYPSAPGPARAAMAGIAANVAVYGLWRCMGVLAAPAMWIVVTVLLVGGVSSLLGVAFAGGPVGPEPGDRVLQYRERWTDHDRLRRRVDRSVDPRGGTYGCGSLGGDPASGDPRPCQVDSLFDDVDVRGGRPGRRSRYLARDWSAHAVQRQCLRRWRTLARGAPAYDRLCF